MIKRSPIAVLLLPLVTFGIYSIYWQVKTKTELNTRGAKIPTAWLLIVPFVNIYWLWKYSEGVEIVTNNRLSAVLAFILLFLLGFIGMAIIQDHFNKLEVALAMAGTVPTMPNSNMAMPNSGQSTPVSQPETPLAMPVNPTPPTMSMPPNESMPPTVSMPTNESTPPANETPPNNIPNNPSNPPAMSGGN